MDSVAPAARNQQLASHTRMSDFNAVQPEVMIAAAQAGVEGITDVLNRTFDQTHQVEAAKETEAFLGSEALMTSGRCLVLQAQVEGGCVVAVLTAQAGLAPSWCGAPDESEKAKLGALNQELFFSVLPEEFVAENQRIDYVEDIASIDAIPFADTANFLRLNVESEAGKGDLLLIWPAASLTELPAAELTDEDADPVNQSEANADAADSGDPATPRPRIAFNSVQDGIRQLPSYARSLLKISVDVSAILAAKKMSVQDVHALSPGSIIEFDKSCEETLTLEIGEQLVAEGEAVRVGERFGIWITQIALPEERFSCANRKRAQ